MDLMQLANSLFGRSRSESDGLPSATVELIAAEGATDSADGNAGITLDADITPPDDYDGDESILDVPTSPSVKAGDDVLVALAGSGPLKTPVVLANPGFGDRLQAQMDTTEELVERAEAAANAVSQHFWHDDNGAHVTQVTQDEWNDTTGSSYHSGPNSLWNSLGMLFRDGLTNLLAVLTNGVAIYDGNGNAASNILAEFTANLVRIGGRFATSGESSAGVQFFADDSSTSDLTASHFIDTDQDMQVYHNLMLDGTTTDQMLTGGTVTHSASGNLATFQQVYNDGTDWSEESDTGITAKTANAEQIAKMGVNALRSSGGQLTRRAYVQADTLRLTQGYGSDVVVTNHDMADVQDALNGLFHLESVQNVNDSGNTYFRASRTDTGHLIMFGIGVGGDNRGIWDASSGAWALYLDANDRLHIPKWSMKRHNAQTSGAVSVATSTNRSVVTLSVSGDEEDVVGMWLLIGHVKFATNTSGRRVAGVTTSANASLGITATNTVVNQTPVSGSETAMVLFDTFTFDYGTTSWTRYLTVWQNSGSALNCEGSLKAIRIGMP